jgi:hypothetical protein
MKRNVATPAVHENTSLPEIGAVKLLCTKRAQSRKVT